MNILLLGTPFFGYIDRISESLREEFCFSVDVYYSFSDAHSLQLRIIRNISRNSGIINKLQYQYETQLLMKLSKEYDVIFVLNGFNFSRTFYDTLKQRYSRAKLVMYVWDDFSRLKNTDVLKIFDSVYSYSFLDSKKYNFKYQPFFYSVRDGQISYALRTFDFSFVGSSHTYRDEVLACFKQKYKKSMYIYNYVDSYSFLKSPNKYINFSSYKFRKLLYLEYVNVLGNSRVILDLPHENQLNITTRPIEALATGTKVLSSSKTIVEYDFYNPINVYQIKNINKIDFEDIWNWSVIPPIEPSESLLKRYSVGNWCKEILGL